MGVRFPLLAQQNPRYARCQRFRERTGDRDSATARALSSMMVTASRQEISAASTVAQSRLARR
jgi:hypothetical protein